MWCYLLVVNGNILTTAKCMRNETVLLHLIVKANTRIKCNYPSEIAAAEYSFFVFDLL